MFLLLHEEEGEMWAITLCLLTFTTKALFLLLDVFISPAFLEQSCFTKSQNRRQGFVAQDFHDMFPLSRITE